MRDLFTVLNEVLCEIPEDEEVFTAELLNVQDSVRYCAPEGMGLWWRNANEVINDHIPFTDNPTGWHKKVVDIWMDKDLGTA